MLEIDVDIGRLFSFARNKALEQHLQPVRPRSGNAQGIAHDGVGGGTAALAQNILAPRELHDVVNRQKERFVFQFMYQREFFFHQAADFFGHSLRKAFA
jgi:hypothetical protein